MCQAVRDGGRRCAIHQHQNLALIKAATGLSGLDRYQTERLFAELRREGRNSDEMTEIEQAEVNFRLTELIAGTPLANIVREELVKASQNEQDVDGASGYAQRNIIERAKARAAKLDEKFQEAADRTGYTKTEIGAKYDELRRAVDTSRNAPVPEEYNQNTRRAAVIANLPYDKASVVALEKLKTLAPIASQRRITLIPVNSSFIDSVGYDEGRLEVLMSNRLDEPYAYHNVPETVWHRMLSARSIGSVYSTEIRGNIAYQYDTEEESEADAYAVRCASCGQFRAAAHVCPERVLRDSLVDDGVPVENISSVLSDTIEENRNPNNHIEPLAPWEIELLNGSPLLNEYNTTLDEIERDYAQEGLAEWESELLFGSQNRDYYPTNEDDAQPSRATSLADEEALAALRERLRESTVEELNEAVANQEPEAFPAPVYGETPASDIPAGDPYSNYDVTGTLDPEVYPNVLQSTEAVESIAYVPTVNNQLVPDTLSTERVIAEEASGFSRVILINKATLYRYPGGRESLDNVRDGLGQEAFDLIQNSPENAYFVVAQSERNGAFTIRRTYDSNIYSGGTNDPRGFATGYTIRHRGKIALTPTYTQEEAEAADNAQRAMLQSIPDATEVPSVQRTSSEYRFDANLTRQPQVNIGSMPRFNQAIRGNKVAILPVKVNFNSAVNHIDDQGFSIEIAQGTEVSGITAVRRNSQGVIETVGSDRSLKCNCADYRAKYYCQHVNYVQRHIANVAQQSLPSPVYGSLLESNERHPLLTLSLSRRTDAMVVIAPDGEDDYVSFGNGVSPSVRDSSDYRFSSRLQLPQHLRLADPLNPTPDELVGVLNYQNNAMSVPTVRMPDNHDTLRTALAHSDVEVPVEADWGRGTAVSGTVRYAHNPVDLQDTTVRSHTLRCTCSDYRENYTCQHVDYVVQQPFAFLGNGTYDVDERNGLEQVVARHDRAIRNEQEIARYMRNGETREQAEVALAAEQERQRRLQEEREARYAAERRADEERRAAQLAREAERARARNQPVITASEEYRTGMVQRWTEKEESYSDNPASFYDDYTAALQRKADGGEAVEFKTENVTDGICADVPGARKFGIELEFDIDSGYDRYDALRKIGRELHEAGLTAQRDQVYYHSARSSGWANWSFEQDSTVDAELVSPIMSDTPESWEQIRKATEIITRNGGIATTRTGSHVHVSTASYELSTAKHAELLRTVNQNEDVLYRLASSPARGRHRGTEWCAPNVSDREDDISAELQAGHNILGDHSHHGVGLNFEGTGSTEFKKSNIEFRMWDATLDPAVIQQQIAISAAITDYAERNVMENDGSKKPTETRESIGTNRQVESAALEAAGVRKHTAETFAQVNGKAAGFFDKLFRTKEHRAAAASLFAATNWQRE